MKMNKKKYITIISCIIIVAVIISVSIIYSTKKDTGNNDEINPIDIITEYINIRYEGLNKDNVQDRLTAQEKYYNKSYINSSNFINSKKNIDDTIKYFSEYNFITTILVSQINEVAGENNKYDVSLSVLYESDDICDTHYAEYELHIEIDKKNSKINNISGIENNKRILLEGMELHIYEGKVEAIPIDDELTADHIHN